ncbi:MAG: aminotransferase class IV [Bacteroidales bacterium]
METAFFNGKFLPKDKICISPDDRGFLFADGIYEVVRWYSGFFFDMEGHLARLKRSLREIKIRWDDADTFPLIGERLIKLNNLEKKPALFYFQVTRGSAPRAHTFPPPEIKPTIYGFTRTFIPESARKENGISVLLKKEIRWGRCDIKSIALLPNTICFEEAVKKGHGECIFVKDGLITEGSNSNIFFVIDSVLRTHPESESILAGITRKNVIKAATECGIPVKEKAVHENELPKVSEAFITNTSAEIDPVITFNEIPVGDGKPGQLTMIILNRFHEIVNSYASK